MTTHRYCCECGKAQTCKHREWHNMRADCDEWVPIEDAGDDIDAAERRIDTER